MSKGLHPSNRSQKAYICLDMRRWTWKEWASEKNSTHVCAQRRATRAMIAIPIFLWLAAIEWNHLGLPHHFTRRTNERCLPSIFTLRRLWHLCPRAVNGGERFQNARWFYSPPTTIDVHFDQWHRAQWVGARCHGYVHGSKVCIHEKKLGWIFLHDRSNYTWSSINLNQGFMKHPEQIKYK